MVRMGYKYAIRVHPPYSSVTEYRIRNTEYRYTCSRQGQRRPRSLKCLSDLGLLWSWCTYLYSVFLHSVLRTNWECRKFTSTINSLPHATVRLQKSSTLMTLLYRLDFSTRSKKNFQYLKLLLSMTLLL